MPVKPTYGFGAILALVMLSPTLSSAAETYQTDFENFSVGKRTPQVNGQPIIDDPDPTANWRGDGITGLGGQGDYDAEIEDLGGTRGNVFRQNNPNSAATGNYDTTHPATPALQPAGESTTGAPNNQFNFSFDFRAATTDVQENLDVRATPFESGTANRNGLLQFSDSVSDGFTVGWFDYVNGFRFTEIETGLTRNEWHSVSVEMLFNDGAANDEINIDVNGTEFALTSWEGFYRNQQPSSTFPTTSVVDSVIFRVPTGGNSVGDGVYFDNLSVGTQIAQTADVPVPATFVLLALGLVGLGAALNSQSRTR